MVTMADRAHPDALPAKARLQCYVLDKVLGQGGFGITYLARDTYLDQLVAIKEYLPIDVAQRDADSTVRPRMAELLTRYRWGLDRFLYEARTLARFDHPNIVRVLSVFEQNGTAYMVMRYEQGVNLSKLLEQRQTLPEQQLLGILLPVLNGLELVHDAKFIHRDIKPDNIHIRTDDSPVLLDFGSARQALGQPRTMTVLVAAGYTPFEQYQSDACGPWTDIYSLGATCYRAITGVAPVDALTRVKSALGSLDDPLVPARAAGRERYSDVLLAAVDHALKISEKERPQTIGEWREKILPSKSTGSHRPGIVDRPTAHQELAADPGRAHERDPNRDRQASETPVRLSRWKPVIWAALVSGLVSVAVVIGWLQLAPTVIPRVDDHPSPIPPAPNVNPRPLTPADDRPSPIPLAAQPTIGEAKLADAAPATPISEPPPQPKPAPRPIPAQAKTPEPDRATSKRHPPAAPTPRADLPAPIPEPKSVVPVAAVTVSIPPPTTMVDASAPSSNKLLALPEAIPPPPVATESIALAPATRPAVASPGAAIKEPPAAARVPARSPVADDEVLADAGDADAQLRMAERYAAGRSGFPSHLLAYTYYQLAFLGGKQEAAAKARDERQRLQPPEIKQADAVIENFRKKLSGAAGSK
jgi:serine/threonine protein kinase